MGETIGSGSSPTIRPEAATGSEVETADDSQSSSDPSPKVNLARLRCEIDGLRFELEDDWGFDSGMEEGGKSESTSGDGEVGWKSGMGEDGDDSVGNELDGRGMIVEHGVRSRGELDRGEFGEDGVRSGGEFDGEESSDDAVKRGGDLEGIVGAMSDDNNSGSVAELSNPTSGTCRMNPSASENGGLLSTFTL